MEPEVIDISTLNEPSISIPKNESGANFGGGIELLMNNKKGQKSQNESEDISLGDLEQLESELNEMSNTNTDKNTIFTEPIKISTNEPPPSVHFSEEDSPKSHYFYMGRF